MAAYWATASDGVRLRYCHWPAEEARGTAIIFTGRSEYLEKYGRVASDLTAAGYHVIAVDWRGQGKSDRLTADRRVGYVQDFVDDQRDVAAFMSEIDKLALPRPRYLIAHSMGGAIAMRALKEGLDVDAVVFSAPMWGIFVPRHLRPISHAVPWVAKRIGQQKQVVLGMSPESYTLETSFDENRLTSDRETYDFLQRQARADEDFALGGATYHWFSEARAETARFRGWTMPAIPAQVYVGTRESIVNRKAIASISARWPGCELVTIEDGMHEMMMERPEIRDVFMAGVLRFFAGQGAASDVDV